MKKLLLIFSIILTVSCAKVSAPPKTVLFDDSKKHKPKEQSGEMIAVEKEKSNFSIEDRGKGQAFKSIISKPMSGAKISKTKTEKGEAPVLNFEDASLREVIKVIADYKKWNYVIDPSVPDKGINIKINTVVKDQEIDDLLNLLLSIYDVAMVDRDGVKYFSLAKDSVVKSSAPLTYGNVISPALRGEDVVAQVVPLHFIAPKDMANISKEFLSSSGKIIEDPALSYMVVIDRKPYVRRILEMVKIFDINIFKQMNTTLIKFENADADNVRDNIQKILEGYPGLSKDKYYLLTIKDLNALLCITSVKEISDEVKYWAKKFERESERGEAQIFVYHCENSDAKDLSNILKELYSDEQKTYTNKAGKGELKPVLKGGLSMITDETNNSIIFKCTKRDYKIIEKTLKKLDVPKKQVLIEVMILDLALDNQFSYGFGWALTHKNLLGDVSNLHTPAWQLNYPETKNALQGSYSFIFDRFVLDSVLNSNVMKSRTNVLSTPHILVLDNESATIKVGEQISVRANSVQTPATVTGGTTNVNPFYAANSYQYLSTGIQLKVKPSISSNGVVRLEINQTYSTPGTPASPEQNPPIKDRSLTTIVNVPDGKSVLLGGLIQESKVDSSSEVPGLNKLPLVKYLFKNKSTSRKKSELIIIITPHVIYDYSDTERLTNDFKREIEKFKREIYQAY
ncbi:general secretion pathway protein D [Thermotomaculum hydrothermale]|uniref:General secretion pathway protein D n=1 Tax=Thermotomaculum hydrothermale TaxID=981385 RepID=A0A7R6SYV3_9BACT|nr:secretin N-terminal domain-containing protein [Thermotomaculum hydrothermale]BBB32971.1 general secretion pathway protein D [Thermotomaculum hydrothermale]